jgi:YVTN family beta-propeller protein
MSRYWLRSSALAVLALTACGAPKPNPEPPTTGHHEVVQRIAGPDGGYDYLSVDSVARKLFVGREYGVMAVALDGGTVTERLIDASDVSAVLVLPGTNAMLSTVYGADKAIIFDRTNGKKLGEIATGKSPDAAAFDGKSGLVFVMNAKSNDTTIIDPRTMEAVATIPLGGKPEAATSDGAGRMFINIEDSAEIAVIDVTRRAVATRYKMAGCEEPTGIAFDAASNTLISACHNRIVKLTDAATGADRGSVPVGANADGAIFNPVTRLAYIPCKDGTMTIFRLDQQARPHDVETVKTQPGARTAALDAKTGRVYLAAAQSTTDAKGEEQLVPGTFNILVVAPK